MNERGVVLLTMARSRSSMTAEIFRRHGVFFGNTVRRGGPRGGYNEHPVLKKLSREDRGDSFVPILEGRRPYPGFKLSSPPEFLIDDGFRGEVWGVKVDAFCWPLFPDARFVCLWRDPGAILLSCMRSFKPRSIGDWRTIIQAHHDEMRGRGMDINTDRLVEGDDSQLKAAIESLGLTYDPGITESVIEC